MSKSYEELLAEVSALPKLTKPELGQDNNNTPKAFNEMDFGGYYTINYEITKPAKKTNIDIITTKNNTPNDMCFMTRMAIGENARLR